MYESIWRVRPLAPPAWPERCGACGHPRFESTGRFRVNANGRRHDVWLLYRCPACGAGRKRRTLHRVRDAPGGACLDPYRLDDPERALAEAFRLGGVTPVPYVVERPSLPPSGRCVARIDQPHFCGLRWDRFLARELGGSRSRVVRAFESGDVRVDPAAGPRSRVADGALLAFDAGRVVGSSSRPPSEGRPA